MSAPVNLLAVIETVSKGTPGPWKRVGSTHGYGIGGDFDRQPGAFALVAPGTSGADANAVCAAVNFLREHGDALATLIREVRSRVASSFDEAAAADDRGEPLIWCQCDVLNPCWLAGRPITNPLRHWGWTPDAVGDGLACPDCQLRAALAKVSP